MKKFLLAFLFALTALSVFAKDIPLKVTGTEWGFEISNLDAKGKRICTSNLVELDNDCFVIAKKEQEKFSIQDFFEEVADNEFLNNSIIIKLEQGKFSSPISFSLKEADSFILVPKEYKFSNCDAFWTGKKLRIVFIDRLESDTDFSRFMDKKKAENELLTFEEKISEKMSELRKYGEHSKNDSYIFSLTENGKIRIAAYIGSSMEDLVIPETIEGLPVEEIGMGFWRDIGSSFNNHKAESIVLNKTINFKTVTIPKTVEYINGSAFENLGIEKIIFAKGSKLKKIGDRAFADNKIKEYSIPITIEWIGTEAFYNNQIEDLYIPRKKLAIGNRAFDSNRIKRVSVFSAWSYIEEDDHKSCEDYKEDVMFSEKHPFINESDYLEEVVFEDGCECVVGEAFKGCHKLKKISIPTTMKRIYFRAFKDCSSLSEIIIRGKFKIDDYGYWNTYYDSEAFFGCPLSIQMKSQLLQAGLTNRAF